MGVKSFLGTWQCCVKGFFPFSFFFLPALLRGLLFRSPLLEFLRQHLGNTHPKPAFPPPLERVESEGGVCQLRRLGDPGLLDDDGDLDLGC